MASQKIILAPVYFVAIAEYNEAEKDLFLTLRKTGQRYKYSKVPAGKFKAIKNERNKGNYIARNIIGKYDCVLVDFVPLTTIEKLQEQKTKNYLTFLAR